MAKRNPGNNVLSILNPQLFFSLRHLVLISEAPLDLRELSLVRILFETFYDL